MILTVTLNPALDLTYTVDALVPHATHRVREVAERQGLDYVFACTVDERARQFFERLGFEQVAPSEVPADKWSAYDPRRRARVIVLRRQLADRTTAVL